MRDVTTAKVALRSGDPAEEAGFPERGKSSANEQAQPWAPMPTAFDKNTANAMDTMEEETPSRPITPLQTPPKDADSETDGGGVDLEAATPSKRTSERPQAESNCAMCKESMMADNSFQRLIHLNFCWSRHRQTLVSNNRIANRTVVPFRATNVCILCNATLDELPTVDAYEHRLICIRNWKEDPSSCPKCNERLVDAGVSQSLPRKAEHLYNCSVHSRVETFQKAQNQWLERQTKRTNTTNCPFCLKSLREKSMFDTMFHRMKCLDRTKPVYCPICLDWFRQDLPLYVLSESIVLHVRTCQYGNKLPPIDDLYQRQLFSQVAGRIRLVNSLLNKHTIGPRKEWGSREHSYRYQRKRDTGRRNTSGLYLTPCTKLRMFATYAKDENIRLVECTRSHTEVWSNLERFRRSAFCVYQMPKGAIMLECHQSQTESWSTVHTWHAKPPSLALNRTKEKSTCEDLRRSAREIARRTGVRMPPGFELNNNRPRRSLQCGLRLDDSPAGQDKETANGNEPRADKALEP